MTHNPNEAEFFLQAAAERPVSPEDAAQVARYRYVLHAIRKLPIPQPPADFARQIEACLRDHPEDAGTEQWLLRIFALAALVLGVAAAGSWLTTSAMSLTAALGDVPWRLLMVIAIGLAGFAVFDTLRGRMLPPS